MRTARASASDERSAPRCPRRRLWLACLCTAAAAIATASEPQLGDPSFRPTAQTPIGFLGRGDGDWPDARPPYRFGEGTATWVREEIPDGRRSKQLWVPRLAAVEPVNIAWKTTLPWWGNSGMVVVDDKVYLTVEMPPLIDETGTLYTMSPESVAAMPDIAVDVPAPQDWEPGPLLLCLDLASGKELWRRGIHGLDLLPAGERERVRQEFWWYLRWQWRRWQLCNRLEDLNTAGGGNLNSKKDPCSGLRKQPDAVRAIIAELRRIGCRSASDDTVEQVLSGTGSFDTRKGRLSPLCMGDKAQVDRIKALKQLGFLFTGYGPHGAYDHGGGGYDEVGQLWCGEASQTPACDGERVYVTSTGKVAAAFRLDGSRAWLQRLEEAPGGRGFDQLASPQIVDDLVIFYSGGSHVLHALDRRSGKRVWDLPRDGGGGYRDHHPVRLQVGGELCLYLEDGGRLVRARDGKVLVEQIAGTSAHSPFIGVGDILVMTIGGQDGPWKCPAGLRLAEEELSQAIRFSIEGDRAVAERLWKNPPFVGNSGMVHHDGLVFAIVETARKQSALCAIDLLSGEIVARREQRSCSPGGNWRGDVYYDQPWCLHTAGGLLFVGDNGRQSLGVFSVLKADRSLDVVSQENVLLGRLAADAAPFTDFWGRFPTMAQWCFHGDRALVRAYDVLYCLRGAQ